MTEEPGGSAAEGSTELPYTGDQQVDEVLGKLTDLSGATVAEQLPIYEAVQRGLQDCLADTGSGRPD